MSALAYLRSQAAEARASGEKPYSLFMVSPERVLGLKRAAEPFRSVEDGGDAETYRYAKTPRTAVKTVRSNHYPRPTLRHSMTRREFRFPRPIGWR